MCIGGNIVEEWKTPGKFGFVELELDITEWMG
jgi:hypothetical protein